MIHSLSHREFAMLQKYIEEQSGILLGEEKAYFVESRLSNLLKIYSLSSYEELFHKACSREDERFCQEVVNAITTNETYWFRDKTPWYILEDLLLPEFIKEMQEGRRMKVRIWSCACSSGQEPYSIAICIDNFLRKHEIKNISLDRFHITATDLSSSIVDAAIAGKYDTIAMERGLAPDTTGRYFTKNGGVWSVSEKIRQAIDYCQFNLKNDSYAGLEYDIIFCRYVLIYFSELLKERILSKIVKALKPQGILFIGASEILTRSLGDMEMKTHRDGVYFKHKGEKSYENSFGR